MGIITFLKLPQDIHIAILCLLDARDVLAVEATCWDMRATCRDEFLWRTFGECNEAGAECVKWKEKFIQNHVRRVKWRHTDLAIQTLCKGHTGAVEDVVLFGHNGAASISQDKTLRTWNTNTGKCTGIVRLPTLPLKIEYTYKYIVTACRDSNVYVWSLQDKGSLTSNLVLEATLKSNICDVQDTSRIALAVGGNHLAVGYDDGSIGLYDMCILKCISCVCGHNGHVECLAYHRGNSMDVLVSGGADKSVRMWNMRQCCRGANGGVTGSNGAQLLGVRHGFKHGIHSVEIIDNSGDVHIVVADGACVSVLQSNGDVKIQAGHDDTNISHKITSLKVLSKEEIVLGRVSSDVCVWNWMTGLAEVYPRLCRAKKCDAQHIRSICVTSDMYIVVANWDGLVGVIDHSSHSVSFPHKNQLSATCLDCDGNRCITGSHEKTLLVCNFTYMKDSKLGY